MQLFIRAAGPDFKSRDEGADYDRPEDALVIAVQSAVSLAADEIEDGRQTVAVEVMVEDAGGVGLLRSMVTISVFALPV